MNTPIKKRRVITLVEKKKIIEASEGGPFPPLKESQPSTTSANTKINLLHAFQFLRRSWDAVKLETLSRCFRKAGFVINQEHVDFDEEENILADMDRLWAVLQANSEVEGTEAEYLAVDAQLETCGVLTLAEIAEDVANKYVESAEVASDSEIVEIEEEAPPVTAREASQAMRIFRSYADHVTNLAAIKLFDQLDDYMAEERMNKLETENNC